MSKFLLLLGPSGVGKSATIEELSKLDSRFVYVSPYMTRPLRVGEVNKIAVDNEQMDEMWQREELLVINELYGIHYGTPRLPIEKALAMENFPVLDWPIDQLEVMTRAFPDQLFVVYISPPSISVLCQRLAKDGRDKDGARLKSATQELRRYWSSEYMGLCDMEVVSKDNEIPKVAIAIYASYLKSF